MLNTAPSSAPTSAQPLRVEQALRLLPDVDGLAPLRAFVVSLSSARGPQAWATTEPNGTIGKRALDTTELRARVPQVIARVSGRAGALYGAALDALESERAGDLPRAVRALVRAGSCEVQDGKHAQARAWFEQALGLAEQLRDRQPEMEALYALGRLETACGYLDAGARAFQRGLAVAEAEGDHRQAALACHGLGEALQGQDQWIGAEAWYTRGLQHARDASADHRAILGALHLGLGEVAVRRGYQAVAADRLQRALEAFETVNDAAGTARVLLAHSGREAGEGRMPEAIALARAALGRIAGLPSTLSGAAHAALQVAARRRLAELYLEAGRLPDAEDEARRAEEVAISNQLGGCLAEVYVLMGRMRGRQGDENGFVFFEQAVELCRGTHAAPRLEADVYRAYAGFRAMLGEAQEARACLERAREILRPYRDDLALERVEDELRRLSDSSPRLNP